VTVRQMKKDWNARARKNPLYYIACDDADNDAVFAESGRRDAAIVMDGLAQLLPGRGRALEIGCGIGRLLEPLAGEFRELCGVDISGEMVRQGRKRLSQFPQISFTEIDGGGSLPFADSSFDFCYSFITFHHIPEKSIVLRFIGEARRLLRPGGIFRFHTFGLPPGILQAVRERVTKKDTWRGCKFTLSEIVDLTERQGLEIVSANWVDPFPGEPRPFFGKNKPFAIWVTARKPFAA